MEVTNKHNLPEPFVRFCEDSTKPKKNTIRVTELINPPQIRHLTRKHWNEIEFDASDQIWALLGTSVHFILEGYADKKDFSEEGLEAIFPTIDGEPITLTGRPDLLSKDGILYDYKVTSVWSHMFGVKHEWENQLNVYRYLYSKFPKKYPKIKALEIIAIYRDWNKSGLLKNESYPILPVGRVSVGMWTLEKAKEYVLERLRLHTQEAIPECSSEERWEKKTTFAVKKQGLERALRVFDTSDEAHNHLKQNINNGTLVLETRKGESVRCASYCKCLPFCEQGKKLLNV